MGRTEGASWADDAPSEPCSERSDMMGKRGGIRDESYCGGWGGGGCTEVQVCVVFVARDGVVSLSLRSLSNLTCASRTFWKATSSVPMPRVSGLTFS